MWSLGMKGADVVVEDSNKVARNAGYFSERPLGQSVCSASPIPRTGRHLVEVQFDRDGLSCGDDLGFCYMMGLVDSSLTQPDTFHRPCGLASSSSGFWGVDDGGIAGWSGMGVRYGHGGWQGVPEAAKTAGDGRVFVSGDRIAFLVDREKATASLFRNGTPIPGLVFEDLPRSSDLYIGVTLFHTGSNARIISSMSENAHGG